MRFAQVVAAVRHGLQNSVTLDLLALGDVVLDALVLSLLDKLVEALLRVHALARLVEVVIEAEVGILERFGDGVAVTSDRAHLHHACLQIEDMISLVATLMLRQSIFVQLAGIERGLRLALHPAQMLDSAVAVVVAQLLVATIDHYTRVLHSEV